MKRLILLATALLTACSTAPQIVPDNTSDSVILRKINHEIDNNISFQTGWQWILWYLPLVFLVVTWGWKQFVRPCPECEAKVEEAKQKLLTENSEPQQ
ncbi:MAG: hypothetical protein EBV05_08025 [Cyanobacteria bacterium WB6_1B_304]|nr:hypothetical protein [Cyanobacteria bacterium WB6_1B_304]